MVLSGAANVFSAVDVDQETGEYAPKRNSGNGGAPVQQNKTYAGAVAATSNNARAGTKGQRGVHEWQRLPIAGQSAAKSASQKNSNAAGVDIRGGGPGLRPVSEKKRIYATHARLPAADRAVTSSRPGEMETVMLPLQVGGKYVAT